jgi:acyl carrier protein
MPSTVSSRTPEGAPNHCPVCDKPICIAPSHPPGDAPCPNCGTLLWFFASSAGVRFYESKMVAPLRDKILQIICMNLGVNQEQVTSTTAFVAAVGGNSLDIVELILELEEEFDVAIPDDDAEHIKTVGDAIDYIVSHTL